MIFLFDKLLKVIILSVEREVEMTEYVNMDEMKAEFLSFAIEAYKNKLGVSFLFCGQLPQVVCHFSHFTAA